MGVSEIIARVGSMWGVCLAFIGISFMADVVSYAVVRMTARGGPPEGFYQSFNPRFDWKFGFLFGAIVGLATTSTAWHVSFGALLWALTTPYVKAPRGQVLRDNLASLGTILAMSVGALALINSGAEEGWFGTKSYHLNLPLTIAALSGGAFVLGLMSSLFGFADRPSQG